jgi:hypothetical protein
MEGKTENKVLNFPPKKRTTGKAEKLMDRYDRMIDNLDYVKSICHLCFAYAESPSQMEPDVILAAMQDAWRRIERTEKDLDYIWDNKA